MKRHDGVLLDDHSLEILRVVRRREGALTTDLRLDDSVDIADDGPYVDKSESTVRRWVDEITDDLDDETDNDRWRHVSSHDLRRSWATHNLVEEGVPVRVMMSIGGWSSYDAVEPYLTVPSAERIGESMRDAMP